MPFVFWLINTVVYITSVVLTVVSDKYELNTQAFLGPSGKLLNEMQAMNPYAIRKEFELWRLLTPLFLTGSFSQYTQNSIFLLIFGSMA